ncbi:metal ABC transporter substrate-binding protein [Pseudoramibacter faecis]|uniref:metal ABC transporter substrate-binding protein n=1 Tax=Pseudoramibacter faecis TaxID=3108534 RepID=UPI002E766497|nr:metal ABC transporter substrate-binding protein [Pseudoramibacter sp. HA2172]
MTTAKQKRGIRTLIVLVLMAALCLPLLATGCGKANESKKSAAGGKKLKVVATVFPAYDWAKQILGKRAADTELTLLLKNGTDLHSYQPSAGDIAKIANCDVFIHVGGESDGWVKDALKEAKNKNMQVINLMEVMGKNKKQEEVKEGMQAEKEDDEKGGEEEVEYDEHVWLSLKNARTLCAAIEKALAKADSAHADTYAKNLKAYDAKLASLDADYTKATAAAKNKTLVFGDRFPFRYLVDDYHLDYYAAFVGCSAESEASFKTIAFLAKKVDALNLKTVMTIENNDHKIAKTIIKNTKKKNQKILTLDSMQSTTSKDIKGGATYLSVMQSNLKVLRKAL